ncbi:outer membrane protein [Aurantimonas sp. 22II-16-19i]|uniref:outer membrane protein n=1 Tax=Aurantimonas sp. 22II-16-19i TaxID=1317114 RepID=UPI0009F7CACD|nr:outer membrane protein [Aurantimonas sp. 22II-16-19i]ORE91143.1 outer surface protein [Aurantimonas sp. 22II-16-19i]
MKTLLLTTVAAIGAWSAFAPAAMAADIIEEPVYVTPPAPVPVVQTSGWYLRGDIGYNFKSKSDGHWDFYNIFYPGVDDSHRYDELNLKNSANFGAGVGYRVNDYFRLDATADYFRANAEGRTECPYQIKNDPNHGLGGDPDAVCNYDDTSKASIWTIMANAYVDVGTYGRITPYIGAGIGAAHVSYSDSSTTENCPECVPTWVPYEGTHPGLSSWRFASSLMAGASVDITEQLKIDAGYKYTRISGGKAFGYDSEDTAYGASGTQMEDNGFNIHTVRAGLRYEFGGSSFGKGKEPAPLYTAQDTVYAEPAPIYK